jgi:hypothetical protein
MWINFGERRFIKFQIPTLVWSNKQDFLLWRILKAHNIRYLNNLTELKLLMQIRFCKFNSRKTLQSPSVGKVVHLRRSEM